MKASYWLITYQWKYMHGQRYTFVQDVWKGSLAEWALMAYSQPEQWILMGAWSISAAEYEQLENYLG